MGTGSETPATAGISGADDPLCSGMLRFRTAPPPVEGTPEADESNPPKGEGLATREVAAANTGAACCRPTTVDAERDPDAGVSPTTVICLERGAAATGNTETGGSESAGMSAGERATARRLTNHPRSPRRS